MDLNQCFEQQGPWFTDFTAEAYSITTPSIINIKSLFQIGSINFIIN